VLLSAFLKKYGYPLRAKMFGKPEPAHLQYVQNYILSKCPQLERIYMIGDNLKSDILGANIINKINSSKSD